MTREDIIRMATEEGIWLAGHQPYLERIKRFSELIAQHEREECIKIVTQGTGEAVQARTLNILNKERMRIANAIRGKE